MISDFKPILFNTDENFHEIEIYFAHDIHRGSEIHDEKKWERFKAEILSAPNRFVIWAGDYSENAITGSKGDVYSQDYMPAEQKWWFTNELKQLKDRTICIVPGNHENNRITKNVGLYPAYDCALAAGIEDRYRQHFAFVDIGVGQGGHTSGKQQRYFGFVAHRMRDCKTYHGSDFVEGIDFAACGHDHTPKDQARSKLRYDPRNHCVYQHDIEVIDCGSFMTYGGYGADAGYRPQSSKIYKLILSGKHRKSMKTIGFHI